jgi:hypothetical protein
MRELTGKEYLILNYLAADEAGATAAEIGLAIGPPRHGRREWASGTLRNLHRKGMAYVQGFAVMNGGKAAIWHLDTGGRRALLRAKEQEKRDA